ncbi:MAG: O-antigen ligase family protein [Patescibacteria group bacterium]|nr:O-antigen ligase family protein [Patescibacteria group bacterium]
MTEYSFYSGAFTEWTTFFLYLSDICLILALFFWFISIFRKFLFKRKDESDFVNKSKYTQDELSFIARLRGKISDYLSLFSTNRHLSFSRRQESSIVMDCGSRAKFKIIKLSKLPKVWLFLAVFLVWVMLNTAINNIHLEISIFQIFKLIELALLVVFIYFNLKSSKNSVFLSHLSFFSKYFSRLKLFLLKLFTKKSKLNEGGERNLKVLYTSLLIIAFSGFLQSLIAIYQFIAQRSLFTSPILAKITGESIIGPQISGVAKIVVDGEKIIRAYGAFPHPNVLGGFLIFTLLITIYLYLEHKKNVLSSELNIVSPVPLLKKLNMNIFGVRFQRFRDNLSKLFRYNNTNNIKSQDVIFSLFWIIIIFTQVTALFFTFSRTAWVGFLLSLLIMTIFYFYSRKIVSRETIEKSFLFNKGVLKEDFVLLKQINFGLKRFFHSASSFFRASVGITGKNVSRETLSGINNDIKNTIIKFKELFIIFLLLVLLIISSFSLVQARFSDNLLNNSGKLLDNSAISDRNFYNNVSRETIYENFILGSGSGTYIFQIDGYLEKNNIKQELQPWQYQPAHNIYFLIASEIGIIGLLFFLLFIIYIISDSIKNVSRETFSDTRTLSCFLLAVFISFLFIGLFDHYFWTLQQGRLMFWLVLGIMLANGSIVREKSKN